MKSIIRYILPLVSLALFSACQKEDNTTLEGFNSGTEVEFIVTGSNPVLTIESANNPALHFAWTIPQLWLSEYSLPANVLTHSIEFSMSSDMSNAAVSEVSETSQTYTEGSLNAILSNLGAVAGTPNDFYVRLATYAGKNIAPLYSKVIKATATPFLLDFSLMKLIYSNTRAVFGTLYSADMDGVYRGFVQAVAWTNYYYMSADGALYGAAPIEGNPFTISSETTMWNAWFPGKSGCYYVEMTVDKEWTAAWINSMTLSGAGTGSLTYSETTKLWKGNITTTTDNAVIQISGAGKRYNKTSSTIDDAATDYTFTVSGIGSTSSESITVPTAGTHLLTIDLNNPKEVTYTIGEAESDVTLPASLYLHDKDAETTTYATLNSRATGVYETFYKDRGNWENYLFTSNTSLKEGTIYGYPSLGDQTSIASSPAASYNPDNIFAFYFDETSKHWFIRANLESNTQSRYEIQGLVISGAFNSWSANSSPLTYNESTKKWSATYTTTGEEWGIEVRALVSGVTATDNWKYKLLAVGATDEIDWGGGDNVIKGNGSENLAIAQTAGTYTITIDLSNSAKYTYTIVKQ